MIKEFIETKITQECDVLVCGGGVAGISAALAAARQGKKVTLLEKQFMLGGLATAGLVVIYLPLCDGEGNQVSFGIAEELLRLSISMGAEADYPDNWLDSDDKSRRTNRDKRFAVRFNPSLFAILAEQELIRAGVNILYGTYAVGIHLESDKINAVIIENKSGRQAIKATSVVDATGD
ncbi:MAG: FAD-dependent oxidoreductase, partial [Clostridia bacterium]|nr:FAD-dependent oxidoreductase [Clostridia bacterium]